MTGAFPLGIRNLRENYQAPIVPFDEDQISLSGFLGYLGVGWFDRTESQPERASCARNGRTQWGAGRLATAASGSVTDPYPARAPVPSQWAPRQTGRAS